MWLLIIFYPVHPRHSHKQTIAICFSLLSRFSLSPLTFLCHRPPLSLPAHRSRCRQHSQMKGLNTTYFERGKTKKNIEEERKQWRIMYEKFSPNFSSCVAYYSSTNDHSSSARQQQVCLLFLNLCDIPVITGHMYRCEMYQLCEFMIL